MGIDINQLTIKNGKCGTEEALKVLCGKWNILIIKVCMEHACTAEELNVKLGNIPKTSLVKKMDYLVENDLLINRDDLYFPTDKAVKLFKIAENIGNYLTENVPEAVTSEQRNQYVNKMIGQKWKARVLWLLSVYQMIRFNEFCRCLEGVSHKVLKEVLLDMENTGMIVRTAYDEKVPKVEYRLSEKGERVAELVLQLSEWSREYGLLTQKVTISFE